MGEESMKNSQNFHRQEGLMSMCYVKLKFKVSKHIYCPFLEFNYHLTQMSTVFKFFTMMTWLAKLLGNIH